MSSNSAVVSSALARTQQSARTKFINAARIQESITAPLERRVLRWLAERTPRWINSDHLTMLGFAAQFAAGSGFALAHWTKWGLPLVVAAIALNWLGDSLDGTLARYQRDRLLPITHGIDPATLGSLGLVGR